MKSVLIISCVFPPEQMVSANISYNIASQLSTWKHVIVLCPRPTRPFGFKFVENNKNENFEKIILSSYTSPKTNFLGRFVESFSFGLHAAKFIEKNHREIDFIYLNVWPIFAQYLIIKNAKKFGIRTILHIQDIYPESLTNRLPLFLRMPFFKLLLPFDKYILREADIVIAISRNMLNHLQLIRNIELKKIRLVQNWQDEETFLNLPEEKNNNISYSDREYFTFMYLGNIGPVAGVEFLIESFVLSGLFNSRLVIAGNGSRKSSCILLAKKFPNEKIEFWDVPSGAVQQIQNEADVMLLPVRTGGSASSIPSKLIAYMFSGKPIIASIDENSDTAECIKEAKCGWVIEPENTEELSISMNHVLGLDEDKLNLYGNNGKRFATDNFSKKINLQKMISIFLQMN